MQTKITNEMPFLKPGTHAAGYPFRADAALANAEITFGTPVKAVSIDNKPIKDGIAAMTVEPATDATFVGLAVAPDEHVIWKLPDDQAVYSVKKGETIAVARKGAWAIALPTDSQTISGVIAGDATITTNANLAIGNKVYVNTQGKMVLTFAEGCVELGEIRDFRIDEQVVAKKGETNWEVDIPAKGGVVVVLK